MTTHAPPPDFDGWQNGEWDGFNYYERACTQEESELLDAHEAAMIEQERRELAEFAGQQRDGFFAMLRSEISLSFPPLATCRHAELDSASMNKASGK